MEPRSMPPGLHMQLGRVLVLIIFKTQWRLKHVCLHKFRSLPLPSDDIVVLIFEHMQ